MFKKSSLHKEIFCLARLYVRCQRALVQHLLTLTHECVCLNCVPLFCSFHFSFKRGNNAINSIIFCQYCVLAKNTVCRHFNKKKSSPNPQNWSCSNCLYCAKFTLSPPDGAITPKQGKQTIIETFFT